VYEVFLRKSALHSNVPVVSRNFLCDLSRQSGIDLLQNSKLLVTIPN